MGEQKRGVKGKYLFLDLLDKVSFGQIFLFWIIVTLAFGVAFFVLSINQENAIYYRGSTVSLDRDGLINSIYYSFITVTTTGYGDISPSGLSKFFAIIEVVFGVLIQGIVVSKLVSFKQETILEEIYNINYEEAFTNYRRGLSLVRTDIVLIMEKIENNTIKSREIRDLWIVFSGLDQTLTNIKNIFMPANAEHHYKKLELAKIELLLNSMKLSMHKVTELVRMLKKTDFDWKDELLLTSIYYDIQTCNEIIDYEFKRTSDRKVIDKLNALRLIVEELQLELKSGTRSSALDEHPPRTIILDGHNREVHHKEHFNEEKPSQNEHHAHQESLHHGHATKVEYEQSSSKEHSQSHSSAAEFMIQEAPTERPAGQGNGGAYKEEGTDDSEEEEIGEERPPEANRKN